MTVARNISYRSTWAGTMVELRATFARWGVGELDEEAESWKSSLSRW